MHKGAQCEVERARLPITIHRHPLASGPVPPVRFVTVYGEQTLRPMGGTAVGSSRGMDPRYAGRGTSGVDGNTTRQKWLSCRDPDCAGHGGI